MKPKVLLVDHQPLILSSLSYLLDDMGFAVRTEESGEAALAAVDQDPPDVVLLDWRMPGMGGEEILARLQKGHPQIPVIILTGVGDSATAVKALKSGAFDYLTKPVDIDKVQAALLTAVETHRLRQRAMARYREDVARYGFDTLVGEDPAFRKVVEAAKRVAEDPTLPAFIEGESGTGKNHLAHAIHLATADRDRPFVSLRVAAYDEAKLEALLFGENGSGGLVAQANGGTLYIDGVTALPLPLQERLIEVLADGRATPEGVRVIAASRMRLQMAVAEGKLSEELSYQLGGGHLLLPPLRERRDDIPLLVDHFLAEFNRRDGRRVGPFGKRALARIREYRWLGNVRELRNLVERTVILHGDGEVTLKDLPPDLQNLPEDDSNQILTVHKFVTLKEMDRAYVQAVLHHVKYNKSAAARLLNVSRQRLRRKLEG
ncbi:MAG: sigma-54-dependent Fis family transcriptional regulator [Nitrospirae bacterium]|nr:MAG: sigma-54-dependent Fis family transcriptional regulator [Nitrospirota bacterium]